MSDEPFLLALARSAPVPGGGSAAAYTATVGLALLEKIVRLESKRPRPTPEERPVWEALLGRVRRSAEILARLLEEDSEAYVRLAEARRSKDERAVHGAWQQAISCPLSIMKEARDALLLAREAGHRCRLHLVADVLVVLQLLRAGLGGAYHVAAANLRTAATPAIWNGDLDAPAESYRQGERVFVEAEEAILARLTNT